MKQIQFQWRHLDHERPKHGSLIEVSVVDPDLKSRFVKLRAIVGVYNDRSQTVFILGKSYPFRDSLFDAWRETPDL